MTKPFDNDVLLRKSTWTDEELEQELEMLNLAHMHLLNLGDRYHLVCDDLERLWIERTSMQRSRMNDRSVKRPCEACHGSGVIQLKSVSLSNRPILESQTCVACEGSGVK